VINVTEKNYYRDSTHIDGEDEEIKEGIVDSKSQQLANWVRQKKWGIDVREAIARTVEWFSVLYNRIKDIVDKNTARQDDVEARQQGLESQFKDVIHNTTTDSEVILARDSGKFGKFEVLDERLEYIENLLYEWAPTGFKVSIKHTLNRQPIVNCYYYEDAIGTEKNGLGTSGRFGGSAPISVPINCIYKDKLVEISLPAKYKQAGVWSYVDNKALLIDENKTLNFVLDIDTSVSNGEII